MRGLLLWAALVAALLGSRAAYADGFDASDTLAAIDLASEQTGVSAAWLTRVVGCETGRTFNPSAVGDGGSSLGAAQLHRGGGELPRFFAAGFTDPFDPYESVLFMAQEFASGRAGAWSCR